jgi:hypothetical protein
VLGGVEAVAGDAEREQVGEVDAEGVLNAYYAGASSLSQRTGHNARTLFCV